MNIKHIVPVPSAAPVKRPIKKQSIETSEILFGISVCLIGLLFERENMASSKEYLNFVLEQLSDLDGITFRAMMGEYIIYYKGKIIGGIYDDRFLVKPTDSAKKLMPEAQFELPYEGAKEMLLVDNVDDKQFLNGLLNAMLPELPEPKKKKNA